MRDGDAPVHRRLHEARDDAAVVQKGLIVQVEQEHYVAGERGRVGSLERLLRIADHDRMTVSALAVEPRPSPAAALTSSARSKAAVVAAAHEDGDGAAERQRARLAGHHHAVGELGRAARVVTESGSSMRSATALSDSS